MISSSSSFSSSYGESQEGTWKLVNYFIRNEGNRGHTQALCRLPSLRFFLVKFVLSQLGP